MHARVTRLEASAENIEAVTRQFDEQTLPELQGTGGFKGHVLLADDANGLAMAITYWDSEADLQASEAMGNEARERAAKTAGAQASPVVERYAVVSSS
jgi:heme-degrading monooxygenase HmoA